MSTLRCEDLTPDRLADYLDFFERRAFTDNPGWAGSYCYFPLHDPTRTHWPQRTGLENRAAIVSCIGAGQARGCLAYLDDQVVGWCNAGPWSQFPMLAEYDEPEAATIGVIFCFVVAPEARGQGVATALLDAACDALRRQGMAAAQAKPVRTAADAAANHLGPLDMYLKAGFQVIRETPEGDVFVRKSLSAATGAA